MDENNIIKGKDIQKPFCMELEDQDKIYFDQKNPNPAEDSKRCFETPFEAIFQNTDDIILISRKDKDGMIRYIKHNPAAKALFEKMGLQKEEISLSDIYQGNELNIIISNYYLCETTGKAVAFLKEMPFKDSRIWLHIRIYPFMENNEMHFCCIAQDQTEFYENKDETLRLQAQYEFMMYNIEDPVYSVDVFPDDRMVLSFMNTAAEQLTGYIGSRVIGLTLEQIWEDMPILIEKEKSIYKKAAGTHKPVIYMQDRIFNQKQYHGAVTLKSIRMADRVRIVAYSKDMTNLIEINKKYKDVLENYNAFFNNSKNIMVVFRVRPDNTIVFEDVNDSFTEVLGLEFKDVFGKMPQEIIPKTFVPKAMGYFQTVLQNKTAIRFEESFRANEKQLYNEVFLTPVLQEDRVIKIIAIRIDITQQRVLSEKLDISRQEYETLFNQNNFGVWVMQMTEDTPYMEKCNDKFCEIFGYVRENIVGKKLEDYYNQDYLEDRLAIYSQVSKKKKSIRRSYSFISNKRKIHVDLTVTPIMKDGKVEKVIGIVQNYTELMNSIEQNKYLSEHDVGTGLYNRRYFNNYIQQIQKKKELNDIFIVSFDLNGLKQINDHFGHLAGDELIIRAANIISDIFDGYVVARVGGDEFNVVGVSKDHEDIHDRTAKFDNPFLQQYFAYPISIAAGISFYNENHKKLEDTIREAEQNMYLAKHKMKFQQGEK